MRGRIRNRATLYTVQKVFYGGKHPTSTGRRLIHDKKFITVSRQDDTTRNLYL